MKNINRRQFVRTVSYAGAAVGLCSLIEQVKAANLPIGLQLYTVRQAALGDFSGTLKRVADIGYKNFEFAGYDNLAAGEIRSLCDRLQAKACGAHEGFQRLQQNLTDVVEFHKTIGTPYLVVPSMPVNIRKGDSGQIRKFAEEMNQVGEKVKQAGMQLCYHNHSFEFERLENGQTIWDVLFETADPELLKAEVDIAWVANAKIDPVEFLGRWGSRVKLLHMKDLDADGRLAPVRTGTIDFAKVVEKAREIGVDWFIVEQDNPREGKDVFDEIVLSLANLSKVMS